jgi:hypothetical protein
MSVARQLLISALSSFLKALFANARLLRKPLSRRRLRLLMQAIVITVLVHVGLQLFQMACRA